MMLPTDPKLSSSNPLFKDETRWFDPPTKAYLEAGQRALTRLQERYESGDLPFLDALKPDKHPTFNFNQTAHRIFKHADTVVYCGVGGSLHAAKAFMQTGNPLIGPTVMYATSIEPAAVTKLRKTLDECDPTKVFTVVASQSGHTTETLALFAVLLDWYNDHADKVDPKSRIICLTGP